MIELHLSDIAIKEIEYLVDQVELELLNPVHVHYFELLPGYPHQEQLNASNVETLRLVATKPGVYALWVQEDSTTGPRYIGHTAGTTAQTRLKNHFFKRDPRTGSQLEKIKEAVANGHRVGFTYVAITPALMRLYIEAALIDRHWVQCVWNKQGKAAKQANIRS